MFRWSPPTLWIPPPTRGCENAISTSLAAHSFCQHVVAKDFSFRTGYEDIRSDTELTAVEIGKTCHILKRLTRSHALKGRQRGIRQIIHHLIHRLHDVRMTLCAQMMFKKSEDHFPRLPLGIHIGNSLHTFIYQ